MMQITHTYLPQNKSVRKTHHFFKRSLCTYTVQIEFITAHITKKAFFLFKQTCYNNGGQSWVGLCFTPFSSAIWDGKEVNNMENFDFAGLYSFLLTGLGMVLAYLGAVRKRRRKKKRAAPRKDNGSETK
jgi:ammonia channel protein AmtB